MMHSTWMGGAQPSHQQLLPFPVLDVAKTRGLCWCFRIPDGPRTQPIGTIGRAPCLPNGQW